MTSNQLNALLDRLRSFQVENEWIEYKMNKVIPEDLGAWISALANGARLANQQYAYLVFGVDDETKIVKGIDKHVRQFKKGNEELEHWVIQRLEPKIDVIFYDFFRGDEKVSLVKISAAIDRPIRFLHKAYIRVGSITRNLNDFPEKERKIWMSDSRASFEMQVAKENVSAESLGKLLDIDTYFTLMRLPPPKSRDAIIDRFLNEKIIVNNGSAYDISNLGAIVLAKDLNDFDDLYRKSIRVIFYKGEDRLRTEKEFGGKRGYALAFIKLIEFIEARLPKNEVIEGALRKDVSMYPSIAIREIIANALIHQDFTKPGAAPLIEVFSNRIEVTNPGSPLIEVLRFIDHNPQSRNEKLAHLMRRLYICEERGSGIDKVIAACEIFQLPAPEFIVHENYTRVKLFAHRSFRQMDKLDKIRACYQHCCLRYVSGEKMSNKSLRKRFNIAEDNYPMASRIIADTLKSELIKDANPASNSKKHASYIPFWA